MGRVGKRGQAPLAQLGPPGPSPQPSSLNASSRPSLTGHKSVLSWADRGGSKTQHQSAGQEDEKAGRQASVAQRRHTEARILIPGHVNTLPSLAKGTLRLKLRTSCII